MNEPNENNFIKGSMAYSYPVHKYEKKEGDSGSQDSPFDYVKKLLYQRQQMNLWYSGNTKNIARNENANAELSEDNWKSFKAPLHSWFKYEYTATNKTQTTLDGQNINVMFIPGYGLKLYTYPSGADSFSQYISVKDDSRSKDGILKLFMYEYTPKSKTDSTNVYEEFFYPFGEHKSYTGKKSIIEAGTDCVGFANRSASYDGNIYKWGDTKAGWTEYSNGEGTDNIRESQENYSRGYPRTSKDKLTDGTAVSETGAQAYNIFTTRNYDSNAYVDFNQPGFFSSKSIEDKKELLKIVPGDIFVKCSEEGKSTTNNEMDSHIAIVAYVPENADEMTVEQLLNSIVLIEAEFSWRVQSVIKTFTLGTYQGLQEPMDLYDDIYGKDASREGATVGKDMPSDKWTLNNRHYAIRRLIWN